MHALCWGHVNGLHLKVYAFDQTACDKLETCPRRMERIKNTTWGVPGYVVPAWSPRGNYKFAVELTMFAAGPLLFVLVPKTTKSNSKSFPLKKMLVLLGEYRIFWLWLWHVVTMCENISRGILWYTWWIDEPFLCWLHQLRTACLLGVGVVQENRNLTSKIATVSWLIFSHMQKSNAVCFGMCTFLSFCGCIG